MAKTTGGCGEAAGTSGRPEPFVAPRHFWANTPATITTVKPGSGSVSDSSQQGCLAGFGVTWQHPFDSAGAGAGLAADGFVQQQT